MKRVVFLVSLMLAATAALAEPLGRDDTATQRSLATPPYRIREVRFVGDPGFETDVLEDVLEELKVRRTIPGIWTRHPAYDARTLEAALARLRSFYVSKGYFEARVAIADVAFHKHDATLTLHVQSGPKARVRQAEIEGVSDDRGKTIASSDGEFPVGDFCKCLLDAKRDAEAQGRLDFAAELEISPVTGESPPVSGATWVDVTARVRTGSPYTVGRINFSGHHRISDSTLRGAMVLQEGALFDLAKLRRSLVRLNRAGLMEAIAPDDVEIERHSRDLTADVTISLRERRRGRWSLSGPVFATGFTGPLEAAISSRLPTWGRGIFEAATYYLTFSLIGLPNPLIKLLPVASHPRLAPVLVLERPYLPGQALFSGFALSPKRSVRTFVESYGATHLRRAVGAALDGSQSMPSTLVVPIEPLHADAGSERSSVAWLICEPPEARLRWLRRVAGYAADLTLGAFARF
jgi:hypothetical protein